MTVAKNCNDSDLNISDLKAAIKKEIFPNIYKILRVVVFQLCEE